MTVLGTAGHVDHGKSTLVRALTGIDPDTLAAEKERGLTIDLGFAVAALPSGRRVHLVDVPGHVRFLKNMLAGAGAVSGVVFVVDAMEGPRAQSTEHLQLLDLLGVHDGVVVITKADLVSGERLDDAVLETLMFLDGSPLAEADPIVVDSVTGRGMDRLRTGLDALVDRVGRPPAEGRARLWIDRAFTAAGAGTVVAGTLAGAALEVGDTIELQPGGASARIRELHTDHTPVRRAEPGNRYAMALGGVDRDDVGRGVAVLTPDDWWPTSRVDASFRVLPTLDHALSRRGAHVLHLGSGEWPVRVRVLGADALDPGDEGHVRLHLPSPLPLAPGDRFVLRESGRGETVGGGTVLEVDPRARAATARPSIDPDRVIADRGWVRAEDFRRLTGLARRAELGEWLVDPSVREVAVDELEARVHQAGSVGLALAELDERDRALAEFVARSPSGPDDGAPFELRDGRLVPPGAVVDHPWLEAVAEGGFDPPPPDGVDPAALRVWVSEGRLVKVGEAWWSADAVVEAARRVATLLEANPDGITVAQVRDGLHSSRKPTLAVLGLFDSSGVTRRRGDVRIGGNRLSAVLEGRRIN
ncbi:MAG: selenocysteine-specific translation elongation factor [Microthrixaceae bacterium]|nr:selenocysteine-specific translation elongation factor [Microthrixaceae bacterium]